MAVQGGDIVDAVFQNPVRPHIMDYAGSRYDYPVTALLDAFNVTNHPRVSLPEATQIGRLPRQGLGTGSKDGRWKLIPAAARCMGDRDVIGSDERCPRIGLAG